MLILPILVVLLLLQLLQLLLLLLSPEFNSRLITARVIPTV